MFENYDLGLLNAALKQISESLAIAPGDSGWFLAAIRLGGLGAFALVPVADRVGRRRVFLAALVGMSAGSLASGDRKSTRLNSSHLGISYAVFCLKKKTKHKRGSANTIHIQKVRYAMTR